MSFALRGPEGAAARMEELQARLDRFFPPESPVGFDKALSGALEGAIDGTAPFNPFGGASAVKPSMAPQELKAKIETAARDAGVDPMLFDSLVAAESGYDPAARSRAGALGLSQLMPDTARGLGVQDPFDPEQNLRGGATYLASLLKRFQTPELALAAYNAGPNRVERAGNQIPNITETQNYVNKVMALYKAKAQ